MPKRTVRIKLSYDAVIDNDREGVPWMRDPSDLALHGCKSFDGLIEIRNVKATIGLDRMSLNEMLQRAGARRANRR